MAHPELDRLVEVMTRLRRECPWDARQTHQSLVQFLIEETGEVVEAIESGDADHLQEELGDLLLQVVFHSEIAADFTIDEVARGIADKLTARHPYVFATEEVPADLHFSWEERKAAEKGRTSVLEGIPEQLSALARAHKVVSRARSRRIPVDLPEEPVTAPEVGAAILALVGRAQASGVDPDQATRAALRALEETLGSGHGDPAGP